MKVSNIWLVEQVPHSGVSEHLYRAAKLLGYGFTYHDVAFEIYSLKSHIANREVLMGAKPLFINIGNFTSSSEYQKKLVLEYALSKSSSGNYIFCFTTYNLDLIDEWFKNYCTIITKESYEKC